MIEDLIDLYHEMLKRAEQADEHGESDTPQIPEYGMQRANVPYAINIDDDGALLHIDVLGDASAKKPRNEIIVPMHVQRSSGVAANLLWDNAAYMLADPSKNPDRPEKARKCFDAAAELNIKVFEKVDDSAAQAIAKFFSREPQWEQAREQFGEEEWSRIAPSNFILKYHDVVLNENDSILDACRKYAESAENGSESRALESVASGKTIVPARIHPKIKGVMGAQSSGASLVSYNFPAACSYGLEQCENGPMSEREAFDYTTVLNMLLANPENTVRIGDVTVVSWVSSGENAYVDYMNTFSQFGVISNDDREKVQRSIMPALTAIKEGKPYDFNGVQLEPGAHYYILGLSPNAARLAVSFYLKDTFQQFATNVRNHYLDIAIDRPEFDQYPNPPVWILLRAAVNQKSKNKNASDELTAAMMRSVLLDAPYPVTLLNAVENRIRAEREITSNRAAIIKGYYARLARKGRTIINANKEQDRQFKEVLQMSLNEDSGYVPYVLGRIFSVYEQIQEAANPKINTTIKDKYFNSACATPAYVFPVLGDLSQAHLRKLKRNNPGAMVNLTKELEALAVRVGQSYPERLSLQEQGAFQLGYYFEDQARYTSHKKNPEAADNHE